MGAASPRGSPGIALAPCADHAAYIDGWLSVLKSDRCLIFQAVAQVPRACDELHKL